MDLQTAQQIRLIRVINKIVQQQLRKPIQKIQVLPIFAIKQLVLRLQEHLDQILNHNQFILIIRENN